VKINDKYIIIGVYLVVLLITVSYAIFKQVITSDQIIEYQLYTEYIKTGIWSFHVENIVNSCLLVTYIPAVIQRITHINAELLFKVFPCLFYSLMPTFTYLTSRRYTGKIYSLLTVCIVLSSFFFLYNPAIGRVGEALGFMTVMIWGVTAKRFPIVLIAGLLLVISHYATMMLGIGLLSVAWLSYIIARKWGREFIAFSVVLLLIASSAYVWHWQIAKISGEYIGGFIQSSTLSLSTITNPDAKPNEEYGLFPNAEYGFLTLESRDPVIQTAFGKKFLSMNIPQKMELALSWFIVLLISLGLIYSIRKKILTHTYSAMILFAYTAVSLSVIIPYVGWYYGAVRAYFSCLPVLAPVASIMVAGIFKKNRTGEWLLSAMLLLHALCVAGVIHRLFGIIK